MTSSDPAPLATPLADAAPARWRPLGAGWGRLAWGVGVGMTVFQIVAL